MRDEDLFVRPEDLHTVLFGSLDAGRSTFASAGFKVAPVSSLDRPGPLLSEVNGLGVYRERYRDGAGSLPALRITTKAATLAGYQWSVSGVSIAALAGPEFVHEQLTVAGRIPRFSEARAGVQGQVELWADPAPWLNVNGTVVVGSAQGSVWARAAAGYKPTGGDLQFGPEATSYMTHTYRETRWGAHVTGIPIWTGRLRISGGWMTTDDKRAGSPYLSVGAWLRM